MASIPWRDVALVAAGGALGCVARFGVSSMMPRLDFPWHTLAVNLVGAFVLGALFLDHGMEHPMRLAVAVGFLGGFTTLSTYSVETIDLWRSGHASLALANIAGNGLGGPLMALVGWRLADSFG
jgi:fluoride exporter